MTTEMKKIGENDRNDPKAEPLVRQAVIFESSDRLKRSPGGYALLFEPGRKAGGKARARPLGYAP